MQNHGLKNAGASRKSSRVVIDTIAVTTTNGMRQRAAAELTRAEMH